MNWSLQIARACFAKLRFSARDSKKNGLLGQLMRAAARGGEVLTQQARAARYRRATLRRSVRGDSASPRRRKRRPIPPD
jgi:hypothetical protein